MFPVEPFTVTMMAPGGAFGVRVRVAVPEPPGIDVGVSEQVIFDIEGQDSTTVTLKPLSGRTTKVDVAGLPEMTGVGENAVANIWKSG